MYFCSFELYVSFLLPQAFAPLGGLFGGGLAGWAVDSVGRKPVLMLSAVPYLIGWLMLALANFWNSPTGFRCFILIGRFITGIGLGCGMLSAPVSSSLSLCPCVCVCVCVCVQ